MIANYRQAVPIKEPEPIVKVDPNTLLLLHGEDLIDSSSYQRELQNSGVTISTAQSKFGESSLYFNGSTYLTLSDIPFPNGTEDFTVDWWQYTLASYNGGGVISRAYVSRGGYGFLAGYLGGSAVQAYMGAISSSWNIVSPLSMGSIVYNSWQHFAVVRNGNRILAFNNGSKTAEASSSLGFGSFSQPLHIGCYDYTNGFKFVGYLNELRISNTARWTENFTPPIEPYEC